MWVPRMDAVLSRWGAVEMISIGGLLKRFLETAIGLLGLAVAGLTLWVCYDVLAHRPDTVSTGTLLATVYVVALLAIGLALFGARLIVPRLRAEGGHVIGLRAVVLFTVLYGVSVGVAFVTGRASMARLPTAVLVLLASGTLIYERLRARPRP